MRVRFSFNAREYSLGRSSRKGALSIWTHHMKGMEWHDSFVPRGAPFGTSGIAAVTLKAGEQWFGKSARSFKSIPRLIQLRCIPSSCQAWSVGCGRVSAHCRSRWRIFVRRRPLTVRTLLRPRCRQPPGSKYRIRRRTTPSHQFIHRPRILLGDSWWWRQCLGGKSMQITRCAQ